MVHSTRLQNQSEIDENFSVEIKEMVKERGETCVSIIVPTHRTGEDRKTDLIEIQKAVTKAEQKVMHNNPGYMEKVDELFQQIDFKRNREGIGIFVSPRIKKLVKFPFPVTKKIVINNSFQLQDLLYVENYRVPYFLLDLSRKEIHLFRGVMDHLEEIVDENFPIEITDNYEYSKPSRSTSHSGSAHLKGFEKDKSELQQLRLKKIFHVADSLLSNYINKETPVILCGIDREISLYKSSSIHFEQFIGSISENYLGAHLHDLEILTWKEIRSFIDRKKQKLVDDLKEKIGEHLAVYGVKNVWDAVKEGRGFKLIVEKDLAISAYVTEDNKLHLVQPSENFQRFPDIVNEIVTTLLEKNGDVIIVEKDMLKDYDRIALINRY